MKRSRIVQSKKMRCFLLVMTLQKRWLLGWLPIAVLVQETEKRLDHPVTSFQQLSTKFEV